MRRSSLLVAALAFAVHGCEPGLDGLCTALGCEGGVRVTIHGLRRHPNASYVFKLVADHDTFVWRCEIVGAESCKSLTLLPVDAEDDPEGWRLSFHPDDDGNPQIWVLGFRDGWMIGPETLALRITEDGKELLDQSWTPSYERLEIPN